MNIASQKINQNYQEAITISQQEDSPPIGFTKVADNPGSIGIATATLRQNNTIISLLVSLHEKIDKVEEKALQISQEIKHLGKQEALPEDFSNSVSELTKLFGDLKIEKAIPKKKGPIYVYKDPKKIFEEVYKKSKQ